MNDELLMNESSDMAGSGAMESAPAPDNQELYNYLYNLSTGGSSSSSKENSVKPAKSESKSATSSSGDPLTDYAKSVESKPKKATVEVDAEDLKQSNFTPRQSVEYANKKQAEYDAAKSSGASEGSLSGLATSAQKAFDNARAKIDTYNKEMAEQAKANEEYNKQVEEYNKQVKAKADKQNAEINAVNDLLKKGASDEYKDLNIFAGGSFDKGLKIGMELQGNNDALREKLAEVSKDNSLSTEERISVVNGVLAGASNEENTYIEIGGKKVKKSALDFEADAMFANSPLQKSIWNTIRTSNDSELQPEPFTESVADGIVSDLAKDVIEQKRLAGEELGSFVGLDPISTLVSAGATYVESAAKLNEYNFSKNFKLEMDRKQDILKPIIFGVAHKYHNGNYEDAANSISESIYKKVITKLMPVSGDTEYVATGLMDMIAAIPLNIAIQLKKEDNDKDKDFREENYVGLFDAYKQSLGYYTQDKASVGAQVARFAAPLLGDEFTGVFRALRGVANKVPGLRGAGALSSLSFKGAPNVVKEFVKQTAKRGFEMVENGMLYRNMLESGVTGVLYSNISTIGQDFDAWGTGQMLINPATGKPSYTVLGAHTEATAHGATWAFFPVANKVGKMGADWAKMMSPGVGKFETFARGAGIITSEYVITPVLTAGVMTLPSITKPTDEVAVDFVHSLANAYFLKGKEVIDKGAKLSGESYNLIDWVRNGVKSSFSMNSRTPLFTEADFKQLKVSGMGELLEKVLKGEINEKQWNELVDGELSNATEEEVNSFTQESVGSSSKIFADGEAKEKAEVKFSPEKVFTEIENIMENAGISAETKAKIAQLFGGNAVATPTIFGTEVVKNEDGSVLVYALDINGGRAFCDMVKSSSNQENVVNSIVERNANVIRRNTQSLLEKDNDMSSLELQMKFVFNNIAREMNAKAKQGSPVVEAEQLEAMFAKINAELQSGKKFEELSKGEKEFYIYFSEEFNSIKTNPEYAKYSSESVKENFNKNNKCDIDKLMEKDNWNLSDKEKKLVLKYFQELQDNIDINRGTEEGRTFYNEEELFDKKKYVVNDVEPEDVTGKPVEEIKPNEEVAEDKQIETEEGIKPEEKTPAPKSETPQQPVADKTNDATPTPKVTEPVEEVETPAPVEPSATIETVDETPLPVEPTEPQQEFDDLPFDVPAEPAKPIEPIGQIDPIEPVTDLDAPATYDDVAAVYPRVAGDIEKNRRFYGGMLKELEEERQQSIAYANGENVDKPASYDYWKGKLGLQEKDKEPVQPTVAEEPKPVEEEKISAPKVEEPKSIATEEAPKTETPSVEVPKAETKVEDAPKTEAPVTDVKEDTTPTEQKEETPSYNKGDELVVEQNGKPVTIVVDSVGKNGNITKSHVKDSGKPYHSRGKVVYTEEPEKPEPPKTPQPPKGGNVKSKSGNSLIGAAKNVVRNKKFNIRNYALTTANNKKEYDGRETRIEGVYHDPSGYAVATDTHVLIATKEGYDESKKGKIIGKNGEEITPPINPHTGNRFIYPKWQSVIPREGTVLATTEEVLDFVDNVKERLKSQGKKPKEISETNVIVFSENGVEHTYSLGNLEKLGIGALHVGADKILTPGETMGSFAETDKGVVLVMPKIPVTAYEEPPYALHHERGEFDNFKSYRVPGVEGEFRAGSSKPIVLKNEDDSLPLQNSVSREELDEKLSSAKTPQDKAELIKGYLDAEGSKNVTVVATPQELVDSVRSNSVKQDIQGHIENGDKVAGLYDKTSGKVYIVADSINEVDDIDENDIHENQHKYSTEVDHGKAIDELISNNSVDELEKALTEVAGDEIADLYKAKKGKVSDYAYKRMVADEILSYSCAEQYVDGDNSITNDNINKTTKEHYEKVRNYFRGRVKDNGTTDGRKTGASEAISGNSPTGINERGGTRVGQNEQGKEGREEVEQEGSFALRTGSFFSGGGSVEDALKGVIDGKFGVEFDSVIAAVFSDNHGNHIINADVRNPNIKKKVSDALEGKELEYFHASPVCKRYSKANKDSGESELDIETAKATADFIREFTPGVVTIENVSSYGKSEAVNEILSALNENGYTVEYGVYNAKDFGGYMDRERFVVRAAKDGNIPPIAEKTGGKGWYEAVEDLIPTLKKTELAPWQAERLTNEGIDVTNVKEPLIVYGGSSSKGKTLHAYASEVAPSINTKNSGSRIIMPNGDVLMCTPRIFARLMGIGDEYKLPKSDTLAYKIIGNSIPEQLTNAVIRPIVEAHDKESFADDEIGGLFSFARNKQDNETIADHSFIPEEEKPGWYRLTETSTDYGEKMNLEEYYKGLYGRVNRFLSQSTRDAINSNMVKKGDDGVPMADTEKAKDVIDDLGDNSFMGKHYVSDYKKWLLGTLQKSTPAVKREVLKEIEGLHRKFAEWYLASKGILPKDRWRNYYWESDYVISKETRDIAKKNDIEIDKSFAEGVDGMFSFAGRRARKQVESEVEDINETVRNLSRAARKQKRAVDKLTSKFAHGLATVEERDAAAAELDAMREQLSQFNAVRRAMANPLSEREHMFGSGEEWMDALNQYDDAMVASKYAKAEAAKMNLAASRYLDGRSVDELKPQEKWEYDAMIEAAKAYSARARQLRIPAPVEPEEPPVTASFEDQMRYQSEMEQYREDYANWRRDQRARELEIAEGMLNLTKQKLRENFVNGYMRNYEDDVMVSNLGIGVDLTTDLGVKSAVQSIYRDALSKKRSIRYEAKMFNNWIEDEVMKYLNGKHGFNSLIKNAYKAAGKLPTKSPRFVQLMKDLRLMAEGSMETPKGLEHVVERIKNMFSDLFEYGVQGNISDPFARIEGYTGPQIWDWEKSKPDAEVMKYLITGSRGELAENEHSSKDVATINDEYAQGLTDYENKKSEIATLAGDTGAISDDVRNNESLRNDIVERQKEASEIGNNMTKLSVAKARKAVEGIDEKNTATIDSALETIDQELEKNLERLRSCADEMRRIGEQRDAFYSEVNDETNAKIAKINADDDLELDEKEDEIRLENETGSLKKRPIGGYSNKRLRWLKSEFDELVEARNVLNKAKNNIKMFASALDRDNAMLNLGGSPELNWASTASRFMLERKLPSYQYGIEHGLVPKNESITEDISEYAHSISEAVENKRVINMLMNTRVVDKNAQSVENGEEPKSKPILRTMDGVSGDNDYVPYSDNVALNGYEVLRNYKSLVDVMFGGRHFGMGKKMSAFGYYYDLINSLSKSMSLTMSGFHAIALSESLAGVHKTGPLYAAKVIMWDILVRSAMTGKLPMERDPKMALEAVKYGVMLDGTEDYDPHEFSNFMYALSSKLGNMNDKFWEAMVNAKDEKEMSKSIGNLLASCGYKFSKALLKIPQMGLNALGGAFDLNNWLLWKVLHNTYKLKAFGVYYRMNERMAKKYNFTPEQLEKAHTESANAVNNMFGGQDEIVNMSSPRTMRFWRMFTLSPDWNKSAWKQFGGILGAYRANEYDKWTHSLFENTKAVVQNARAKFSGHPEDKETEEQRNERKISSAQKQRSRSYWLMCMLTLMSGGSIIQWINRRDDMEDMAEKKKSGDVPYNPYEELGYEPYGEFWGTDANDFFSMENIERWREWTMGPWNTMNAPKKSTHTFLGRNDDGTELYIRLGKQFRELDEFFFDEYGDFNVAQPIMKAWSKAAPNLHSVFEATTGRDPLTGYENREITNSSTISDQLTSRGKALGKQFTPFSVRNGVPETYIKFFLPVSKGISTDWTARQMLEYAYNKDYNEGYVEADGPRVKKTIDAIVMNMLSPKKAAEGVVRDIATSRKKDFTEKLDTIEKAVKAIEEAKKDGKKGELKWATEKLNELTEKKIGIKKDEVNVQEDIKAAYDKLADRPTEKDSESEGAYQKYKSPKDYEGDAMVAAMKKKYTDGYNKVKEAILKTNNWQMTKKECYEQLLKYGNDFLMMNAINKYEGARRGKKWSFDGINELKKKLKKYATIGDKEGIERTLGEIRKVRGEILKFKPLNKEGLEEWAHKTANY